jgi:hypothetical protein
MHPRVLAFGVYVASLWLSGCSAENPKPAPAQSSPNAVSTSLATTSGFAAPASNTTSGQDSEQIAVPVDDGTNGAVGLDRECQRDVYEAKPVELNLLLLVDLSGSMLGKVDSESLDTQWDAVRGAIRAFVDSPDADGLGISITYYPVLEERTACTSNAMCDDGTPCITAVCAIPTLLGYSFPCESNADCPLQLELEDGSLLNDECVLPYSCTNYPLQFCLVDENCPNGDTCDEEAGPIGACPGVNSCAVEDYATPAVPLQVLPNGRDALLDSLNASYVDFFSATPTHVALEGAFEQVQRWREANPEKRSVVVLATDGVPEGCETILAPDAAVTTLDVLQTGAADDVPTFVIGVLPEDDDEIDGLAAQIALQTESLEAMATAGATQAPILVRANVNTTQAFLSALDQVRTVALPCDYDLPSNASDFNRVNVELTASGDVNALPKVDNRAACEGAGWYYDSDETAADDDPKRVVLCPSSCDAAKQPTAERVDVVLGCPTIRQIQ